MAAAPVLHTKNAHANIGQSLFIKGEVSGSEDLTVDGRVEGRIDLKDHNLTIGPNGRVHADVHAKNITIIGEVTGNVVADEKVDLTDSGRLVGDIRSPRIAVSDGAQFKGSVDMVQTRNEASERRERKESAGSGHSVQVAQAGKALQ
ncbi:MAG TPA: polymer-forming cytoskeletal protein [Candidatus Polarisedimenticolia bacterium]|nr:polymer-forming cytoskeletal protein [Candidatus Polarisedimenticolia bacterium]